MEKPLSEFHKKASSKDGLAFCCKECRNQFGRDAYIALPKEQRKIIRRQKYLSNREYQLEHARRYIAKHPEKRRKYQSTYVAKYPLRAREFTRRYKARKKFATNGKVDYSLIIKQFGYICHICNGTIDHNDLHMDHVIPLSRGGAHSQGNLMPSHSICNLRKHDKLMEELTEYERRGPNA
jgi:5-methylcytosine-specific restriction endonuclease McrA